MSSSHSRQPLNGVILQGCKVVGGICLPVEDVGLFIDQFNHCYGPLRLRVDDPGGAVRPSSTDSPIPVGAGFYAPFRPRTVDSSGSE
jgi:hypothetical protein